MWIPAGAAVGFLASFLFGDLIILPVDLYYLLYFAIVLGFLWLYVKRTNLDLRVWIYRRLVPGVVLGLLGGLVLMRGVLARPETEQLSGGLFWWALFWRGLVYGSVDGLLLLAFPWIVTWRAFGAERRGRPAKFGFAAAAWTAVLVVTTAYTWGTLISGRARSCSRT